MAEQPKPARPEFLVPQGTGHEEASQGSGATSTNVRIAQQIVNQAKSETKSEKK